MLLQGQEQLLELVLGLAQQQGHQSLEQELARQQVQEPQLEQQEQLVLEQLQVLEQGP